MGVKIGISLRVVTAFWSFMILLYFLSDMKFWKIIIFYDFSVWTKHVLHTRPCAPQQRTGKIVRARWSLTIFAQSGAMHAFLTSTQNFDFSKSTHLYLSQTQTAPAQINVYSVAEGSAKLWGRHLRNHIQLVATKKICKVNLPQLKAEVEKLYRRIYEKSSPGGGCRHAFLTSTLNFDFSKFLR